MQVINKVMVQCNKTYMCIFEAIRDWVLSHNIPFVVTGAHRIDLNIKPSIKERLFSYDLYVSQSNHTGAAYIHRSSNQYDLRCAIGLTNVTLAKAQLPRPIEFSILDSVLDIESYNYKERSLLCGNLNSKAQQRARFVRELAEIHFQPKGEVHLIGHVSLIVDQLTQCGFNVLSYDNDEQLLNLASALPNEQNILPGNSFFREFKHSCDTGKVSGCIATGMTVVNDSFKRILDICQSMSIPLGLYAESGSSFAPLYRELGVRFVLAERFPFYVFHGDSVVYIFD